MAKAYSAKGPSELSDEQLAVLERLCLDDSTVDELCVLNASRLAVVWALFGEDVAAAEQAPSLQEVLKEHLDAAAIVPGEWADLQVASFAELEKEAETLGRDHAQEVCTAGLG